MPLSKVSSYLGTAVRQEPNEAVNECCNQDTGWKNPKKDKAQSLDDIVGNKTFLIYNHPVVLMVHKIALDQEQELERQNQTENQEDQAIKEGGDHQIAIFPNKLGRIRQEGNHKKHERIDPENGPVDMVDQVEEVVVGNPEHRNLQKANGISDKVAVELPNAGKAGMSRLGQVEHHNGHDNGEDGVVVGEKTFLFHSSIIT